MEKMMSATSASHSTESSKAFFSKPFLLFEKVTCLLVSFSMRFIWVFPLTIFPVLPIVWTESVIFLAKKQTENEIWIAKENNTSGVSKNRNQTWQNFNVEANNGIFCAPEWVDPATKEVFAGSITETLTQFSGRERNRGSSDWLIDGLVVPPI